MVTRKLTTKNGKKPAAKRRAVATSTSKAAAKGKTSQKAIAKATSVAKAKSATKPTRRIRSGSNPPLNQPISAYTPVTLTEQSPELRSEIAELRGQLQALVANLGTRQMVPPTAPQVLMLQPMGMGGHDDWQARHELTHERDDLRKMNQAKEVTIAQLEHTIASTQMELHAESEAKALAEGQLQRLAEEKAKLQSQLHTETQAKQAALGERDALQQRVHQSESLQKELQEESDLLLSQLHQVQEELEHYFLEAQALKQEKERLEQRIGRLLKRLPGTVEWDDLVVEAGKASLTLTLQQVATAQRQVPQLKLVLARQKKQLTIEIIEAEGQASALLRGRLTSPINPLASADSADANVLAALAPSDIALLQQLCASLALALPEPTAGRDRWASDLSLLAEQLKSLPPAWRFDAVRLRHEQVNPDYEHLWVHFDNASFASRNWPSFEFRLSAANVRKGKFSQHPKLEFPDPGPGASKQFENWFEESEDDHGAKFELRFDLRKNVMDMGVWSALNHDDQAQMLSLVGALPGVLQHFASSGVKIARPWDDWHALVEGVRSVMSQS
jgi:hypothetical protein